MRDKAIRNTHPTVVSINAEIDATDAQGNPVLLDEAKIAAEVTRLQAAHAATQYRRDRVYPPLATNSTICSVTGRSRLRWQHSYKR